MTLKGTVHPLARPENDRGAVADGVRLDRIQILLQRSGAQEAALKQLISDLHTPGTASYHHWLTPEEFGQQFGPSDGDIAAIAGWLQQHGFGPVKINPGRQTLETTGSVAQFRDAFHTQIHSYEVNGQTHFANATDPQIPAALAPVFAGFASLNNFPLHSAVKKIGRTAYSPATHNAKITPGPDWTIGNGQSNYFVLAPGDFAVQYDLNPLYSAGTNGTGQAIAIINESNIDVSLVNSYRTLFGLPASPPQIVIDGNDPGIDGVNNPDGPNYASLEAYLDVELAGAVAPQSTIDLVIAADTALQNGLSLAAERAVYANIAPVMSVSFGTCEADLGSSDYFWSGLWEQAAAQGITVMVSAGDGGSAGCDDFDTQDYAIHGSAVNGLASTPYNVAVGGTDFYYSSSLVIGNYWANAVSNSTPMTSLLAPVPEQAWNDTPYGLNQYSYYAETGLTTIVAGSGGDSTCGLPAVAADGSITACAPYPKPAWQKGTGVPTDGARDLPDLSLFAANGYNLSFYPICAVAGDCQPVAASDSVQFTGVGGTSASSPAFAGMMALVNQKTGSRQGQANFVLYPLATQFPAAFHDITFGTNTVPCNVATTSKGYPASGCIAVSHPLTITDPVYGTAVEGEIGSGTTPEYNAGKGYDLATGLGSVDAYKLVTDWNKVSFKSSTTTLKPSATSFTHGTFVTVSGTVTGTASPLPSGDVELMTTSTEPLSAGKAFYPLSGGKFSGSLNSLPGGRYNIYGQYGGDPLNAASASNPVVITVSPESSTLTLDLFSSTRTVSMTAGATVPYGTQVLLSGEPVPTTFYNANSACILAGNPPRDCGSGSFQAPTGTVAFTDRGKAVSTAPLDAEGDAEYNAVFGVGAHSVKAAYSGDASYNPATSAAVTFTVAKDVPVMGFTTPPSLTPNTYLTGQALSFTVLLENLANGTPQNSSIYTPALAPTGSVTLSGVPSGVPTTAALSPTVDPGTSYPEAVGTITLPATLAPGTYNVTVTYPGDANYTAVSKTETVTLVAPQVISTVAGNGIAGFSGDGGAATSAQLNDPSGAAVDSAGNIYVADFSNGRIRKLNKSTGVISTVAGGGGYGAGGDGGPATSAQLSGPFGVAVDSAGNLYIADTYNFKIRKVSKATGLITTVAGSGTAGFSGDGGAATNAELAYPLGVAVDGAGNLYIADSNNYRIRKVSAASGLISTVAGNGISGFNGDGGAATAAEISEPYGVSVDKSGNLYIADTFNQVIREVSAATGLIRTVAGNLTYGYGGDGGAATSANLAYPQGIVLDSAGDLYIADSANYVVRKVLAATGVITTVAGNHAAGYSGDGGPAVDAELYYPQAVAADSAGDLYVADLQGNVIREVSSASTSGKQVTATPAFTPVPGSYSSAISVTLADSTPNSTIYYTLDGSTPTTSSTIYNNALSLSASTVIRAIATAPNYNSSLPTAGTYLFPPAAPVFTPAAGTYDSTQTVNITDTTPGAIFYYTTDGTDPTTSNTDQYYSGPITVSASETLQAVAYSGNFSASSASAVSTASYVISSTAANLPNFTISTIAGNGIYGFSGDGGNAASAKLSYAWDTAVDSAGNLYIADLGNNRVRKVTKATGVISTVAGNGKAGFSGDGGAATSAELNRPDGLAIDTAGNLYISDSFNSRVRKVSAATGVITTVAGNGKYGSTGDGGAATGAELSQPSGLALDAAGNLYIADAYNSRIRKLTASTGKISTVAGDGSYGYSGDGGSATAAQISYPFKIALDAPGNLYIADPGNDVIREVAAITGIITTVAGNGTLGYSGDGGPATSAQLDFPEGVTLDSSGDIFISDSDNEVIREVIAGSGTIATIAGSGFLGYSGDGGPATVAQLGDPSGVTADSKGNVFIADNYNNVVRELSVSTGPGTQVTATPVFTPAPAAYDSPVSVSITDSTPNSTIYYTIDGSTPTTSSSIFKTAVTISTTTIVRAVATAPNFTQSSPTAAGYVFAPAAPVFTPAGATYTAAQTVTITDATPGAEIYYTTDGTSPAASYSAVYYTGPVTVSFNETFQAVALPESYLNLPSAVTSASYVISGNPVNSTNRIISTVAGIGKGGFSGDGGLATNAQINFANDAVVDSAGNIYIADTSNSRIRKVTKSTGLISTIAGNGIAGYSGDGGAATAAEIGYPYGVAVDTAGNIYIADTDNSRIRKVTASNGIISTVAGNGKFGSSGDGGAATNAELGYPEGLALDSAGNIYIADTNNSKIRKVTVSTGIISTVAGNGAFGYSGDGGAATAAALCDPAGVASDSAGDLFIADSCNAVVRKVSAATGIITTVAGNGSFGYTGDGGPALDAELSYPQGVGLDSKGDLYIADMYNGVIREVVAGTGVIATSAGNGGFGYSGDGGPAVDAQIFYPTAVALDSAGDVYITDSGNSAIREVFTSTASSSQVAATPIFTPVPGSYNAPVNVTISDSTASSTIYYTLDGSMPTTSSSVYQSQIAVSASTVIRAIATAPNYKNSAATAASYLLPLPAPVFTPAGGTYATTRIVTITDTMPGAYFYYTTDGSDPSQSQTTHFYSGPITVNSSQTIKAIAYSEYFDAPGSAVTSATYVIPPDNIITSVAGNGNTGYSGDGGPAIDASFNFASHVVADGSGNLYISDSYNNVVRKVTPAGTISTIVGTGQAGFSGDGGPATKAQLYSAEGLALDSSGDLYIADEGNGRIRKVTSAGIISTVAGNGVYGFSGDGGAAASAELAYPFAVAVDKSGDLFIADFQNQRIRMVNPSGTISTVAGNGTQGFSGDGGSATNAALFNPVGVAVDNAGHLYIADYGNGRIRQVNLSSGTINTSAGGGILPNGVATQTEVSAPLDVSVDSAGNLYFPDNQSTIGKLTVSTGILSIVAGNGTNGFSGDGSSATSAELNNPSSVGVDPGGNLYIADSSNERIRKVTYLHPLGNLELAVDATTKSTTIVVTDNIFIGGWVADPVDGSPVGNVNILVDGVVVGTPTLGIARPDVASYYNNPAYANSGFTFSYKASLLSVGTHTVTVLAVDSNGLATTLGPLTITVTAVYPPPIGNLEQAVDASTRSTTIPSTDNIFIGGWVADPIDGSPLSNVKVLFDGTAAGTPTLGIARPDVASYYNNPAYGESGFNLTYSASLLTAGVHRVTVVAINSHGVPTTLGPLTITIKAANRPPVGNLDQAVDSVTAKPTISQAGTLFVSGWAADYQDNGPAKSVEVMIDGAAVGAATLGEPRPDVAAFYNNPAWANSGWSFTYAAAKLSIGMHTVTAVATDSLKLSTTLGPATITVTK